MRKINSATLARYLSIMNNGEIDFFLGSGASANAGIPTGSAMVWEFKRDLYCTENEVSKDLFKKMLCHEELYLHCHDVQRIAENRLDSMMVQLLKRSQPPDKATDGIAWTAYMNTLKHIAEESIYSELIYE